MMTFSRRSDQCVLRKKSLTDTQTDKPSNKRWVRHSLLGGDNKHVYNSPVCAVVYIQRYAVALNQSSLSEEVRDQHYKLQR